MTIVDRRYSVAEGTAFKAPCAAATTANITLSGAQTIDGVAVTGTSPPTRVLVKDQSTASQNGIYDVSTGNWTRARDFDGAYDVVTGTAVYIAAGTVNARYTYLVSTTGTITIGTTSIAFVQDRSSESIASAAASAAAAAASAASIVVASFGTQTLAAAATISASASYVRTAGYATAGDGGAALYIRAASNYQFTSADGAHWQIADKVVVPQMFGAVANGSTDDAVAIQAALTTGRAVFFPAASYATSVPLNILTSGQTVSGGGSGDSGALIVPTFASGNVFNIGDGVTGLNGVRITNISIAKSGAAMSGGAMIRVGKNCANNYIDHVFLSKGYIGIFVEGGGLSSTVHISDFYIQYCAHSGIKLGDTVGVATDVWLSHGTIAVCGIGIYIVAVSGLFCSIIDIILSTNNGIQVDAGALWPTVFMFFDQVLSDSSTNYGLLVTSAGGYIAGISFVNCWFAASGIDGVLLNTLFLDDFAIQSSQIRNNNHNGILVSAGTNVMLKDNKIYHNSLAGATLYHGIAIAAGVSDFMVTGNVSGRGGYDSQNGATNLQGWGILLNAGASDRYFIKDNRAPANVTGGVSDGGAGINKVVSDNTAY